jgi:ppGpp synthetase/RelA/SpoT-type nucleotidyltranferase
LTLAQAGVNEHQFVGECASLINNLAAKGIFALASGSKAPDFAFITKPYDSVVDKTFRLNCHWNRVFPNEPRQGWIKSENWFSTLDDLIRTSLVCRYLDGPEQVCAAITTKAKELGLVAEFGPRATDEGYYAFHCYIKIPVNLMTGNAGSIAQTNVQIEIQVTTQLQDVLRDLTHPFYRARRIGARRPPPLERWDYNSVQFRSSYLAHALHLIESMIVQLRNEATMIEKKPRASRARIKKKG